MKPLYWISLFAGIGLSGVTALQFSPVKEGINWLRARDAYYLGGAAWSEGFCPKAIEYFDQSINLSSSARAYRERAWIHERLGRYSESLKDYEEAIKLNPNDPYLYVRKGLTLSWLGDHTKSRESLEKAIDLAKISSNHYDFYIQGLAYLGFANIGNEDPADAIEFFQQAISTKEKAFYHHELASFYQGQSYGVSSDVQIQYFSESLNHYNRAIELSPRDPWQYVNRASLYQQLYADKKTKSADASKENLEKALADINQAIEIWAYQPSFYLVRASIHEDLGNEDSAEADYNQILLKLKTETSCSDPTTIRATTYSRLKDWEKAIDEYENAIDNNQDEVSYHAGLADVYYLRGQDHDENDRKQEALTDYREALKIYDEHILSKDVDLSVRKKYLFDQGVLLRSLSFLLSSASLDTFDDEGNPAELDYDPKELKDILQNALNNFAEVLECEGTNENDFSPDNCKNKNYDYFNYMGLIYGQLANPSEENYDLYFERATLFYQAATQDKTPNGTYFYNLAVNYSVSKKYKEAIAQLEQAIRYDDNNPTYYEEKGLSHRRLSQELHDSSEVDMAKEELKNAILSYDRAIEITANRSSQEEQNKLEFKQGHSSLYLNRGVANAYLADYEIDESKKTQYLDQAVKDGEKAIDLNDENRSAYEQVAEFYQIYPKYDEAIKVLKTAIDKLDPEDGGLHSRIALIYNKKEDLDNALAYYEKAIEQEPENRDYQIGAGDVLYNQAGGDISQSEDWSSAIEKLDLAITYNQDPYYYSLRGLCHRFLDRDQQAIDDFIEAGDLFIESGEYELAVRQGYVQAYYFFGLIGIELNGDTIDSVYPQSPADRGGLEEGDRIIAVNGESGNWLQRLRGEVGSTVNVIVEKDFRSINIDITRTHPLPILYPDWFEDDLTFKVDIDQRIAQAIRDNF